jgi:hypothetical protein
MILMSAPIVVVETALQSNSNVTQDHFMEGFKLYKERNEGKHTELVRIIGKEQES